ncbi:MAG: hypothetical protein F6K41_23150 [Symploca sp. SIO3E6]|nr:hypothetical protein [Caldora sp. SIO3E6]
MNTYTLVATRQNPPLTPPRRGTGGRRQYCKQKPQAREERMLQGRREL